MRDLLLSLIVGFREDNAILDIKRWSQCVRTDIADFVEFDQQSWRSETKWPLSEADITLNIKVTHAMDRIWGDSAHWYKAITSPELPECLRHIIETSLDGEVRKIVKNLRNITEHWEENRRYFEDPSLPKPSKSVQWYQSLDLINGPWSYTWCPNTGYELGQVLRLDRLLVEIGKVDSILAADWPASNQYSSAEPISSVGVNKLAIGA